MIKWTVTKWVLSPLTGLLSGVAGALFAVLATGWVSLSVFIGMLVMFLWGLMVLLDRVREMQHGH